MDISPRHAASDPAHARKQELACLRMETDCLYLADAVDSPALKSHFTRMAKTWSNLAVRGLAHGYQGQDLN